MTFSVNLTADQLTGQDPSELITLPNSLSARDGLLAHPRAINALEKLHRAASKDNLAFKVVSSYRSFEQQQQIWNRKFHGKQVVLDMNERDIDINNLTVLEKINAIMRYSALPGASRHHWGTDFDIFPSAALDAGYQPQLVESEFVDTNHDNAIAIASELNQWLIEHLPRSDFFRPYAKFQDGIAPEPWHISYQPIAELALNKLSTKLLEQCIQRSTNFAGLETVISNMPALYQQYISNICQKDKSS